MTIRLVNLGDIHFETNGDWAANKGRQLGRALATNSGNIDHLHVVLNGDLAYSGTSSQFALAQSFLSQVRDGFRELSNIAFDFACTPGNHDCDFSGDQSARKLMLENLTTSFPPTAIKEIIFKPLENYFSFVEQMRIEHGISESNPFKSTSRISSKSGDIEVIYLNSSWMSAKDERPGSLLFPQELLTKEPEDTAPRIVCMHHPANWFKQPETMRDLIRWITANADLCLFGHEHVMDTIVRLDDRLRGVIYLEGGSFQDNPAKGTGSFQMLDIVPENGTLRTCDFAWCDDHFQMVRDGQERNYREITARASSTRMREEFVAELDDPKFPGKVGPNGTRLKDIFVYPDCLEYAEKSCGPKTPQVRKRINGKNLPDYLLSKKLTLLFGPEKCGKTSLARQLALEYHGRGKMPVLLNARSLAKCFKDNGTIEREVRRELKRQYASVTLESLSQNYAEEAIALVDDFEDVFTSRIRVVDLAAGIASFFAAQILIASEELAILETQGSLGENTGLAGYKRLEICDLGHEKVQELTVRWLKLNAGLESDDRVRRDDLAKVVSQILATDFIPHHPWIVIVLLHTSVSDSPLAVSDGSYGHLYHAIVTSAMASEQRSGLDLNGKFTYLSHLAYQLFVDESAHLTSAEMEEFHSKYCERFDADIALNSILEGLTDCRILRRDEEGVAFNARYSYCFFLAWYLKTRIKESDTQSKVLRLLDRLYHRESANILLFLSHLAPGTWATDLILAKAKNLFDGSPLWNLQQDTRPILNLSDGSERRIELPASTPAENRLKEQRAEDQLRQELCDSSEFDGRSLEIVPAEEAEDDWEQAVREVQAAFKMIRILGQVLKNNVNSMEGSLKQEIVEEVFRLSRRMLGEAYAGFGSDLDERRSNALKHLEMIQKESKYGGDRKTLIVQADKEVIEICLLATVAVIRNVSEAVGAKGLQKTYKRVLEGDSSLPNRLYQINLLMENDVDFPTKLIERIARDLRQSWFGKELLKTLVAYHFYMYDRPYNLRQRILQKLEIGAAKALDPNRPAKKPPRLTDSGR